MENFEQEINKLNDWNASERYAEVSIDVTNDLNAITDESDEEISALYVVQGNAFYGLGRFEDALKAYGKAIELDTFNVEARCNYGSTLYTLGRYIDALNACDAAILTDENFAPSYVNVAHCLVALQHEEEAVYALQQAFSLEPNNIELGKTVAEMAADLENFDVALETYLAIAALPDAPKDVQTSIHNFFIKFKENPEMDRSEWRKGVDTWRSKFATNPEVLRFTGDLLRG